MKNDFKVGDTIRILKPTTEQKNDYGPGWALEMEEYIDKLATIIHKSSHNGHWFLLDIDHGEFWWDSINLEKSILNNQLVWI